MSTVLPLKIAAESWADAAVDHSTATAHGTNRNRRRALPILLHPQDLEGKPGKRHKKHCADQPCFTPKAPDASLRVRRVQCQCWFDKRSVKAYLTVKFNLTVHQGGRHDGSGRKSSPCNRYGSKRVAVYVLRKIAIRR